MLMGDNCWYEFFNSDAYLSAAIDFDFIILCKEGGCKIVCMWVFTLGQNKIIPIHFESGAVIVWNAFYWWWW